MTDAVTVPRRRFGAHGASFPVFSLGSWNTWDRMSASESVDVIQRASEVGAAFFDVAHYNMGPHAENAQTDVLFGEAIEASGLTRDQFDVCGKLWLWEYPDIDFTGQMTTSLSRAGLDRVDTLVVGDYMADVDIPRIVREVGEQIEAGRVSTWGVNNWPIADLRVALDTARDEGIEPPTFAQLKYSLVRRSMAEGSAYGERFESGEIGLQASDVFEGGILVGKLSPQRKIGADVGGIRERIVEAYPAVQELAAEFEATPAQLGIAFCLAHPATANVLFGARGVTQLNDNLGALELLDRVGAEEIRRRTADLWLDQSVNAEGGLP